MGRELLELVSLYHHELIELQQARDGGRLAWLGLVVSVRAKVRVKVRVSVRVSVRVRVRVGPARAVGLPAPIPPVSMTMRGRRAEPDGARAS